MAVSMCKLFSSISILTLVLLVILCSQSTPNANAYVYNRDYSKSNSYYGSGISHNHKHQTHGNNGRLHKAAVGVINRPRHVPYTPNPFITTTTVAPISKLSPLDRLMNRLDSEERKMSQINYASRGHHTRHHDSYTNRHHNNPVPSAMLRSGDHHRYTQLRSRQDDAFEDDDEEDDDDDDEDDMMDDEDDDDDDVRINGRRERQHLPHRNHNVLRNGHSIGDEPLFDGVVSDFPEHQATTTVSSNLGIGGGGTSGIDSGNGQWNGGYSSHSDWKWQVLNRQNMDKLRNRGPIKSSSDDMTIAVQHVVMMEKEGACKVPKPRLVQVKEVYPHPSKTYIPHCTILYRCTDDTGCCKTDTFTCAANKTELVELYFYTRTVSGASRLNGRHILEKLVFHNHTECACVDRQDELMPRDRPSLTSRDTYGRSSFRGHSIESLRTGSDGEACRCTSQFFARHVADGSCVCDCFDKQRECIRSKRGKDFLPIEDRNCVLRGECNPPNCEFGTYLRKSGRCPKKVEKFEAWQHNPLHDEEYK